MSSNDKKVIFVFGSNCPHCEDVANTELFKNISDTVDIVFDTNGFVIGADYADPNDVVERRYGLETPTIVFNPLHEDPEIFQNRLGHFAKVYSYLGIRLKGRKRKVGESSSSSSSRRSRRSRSRSKQRFVERKQLEKDVIRFGEECEGEVCRE